METRELSTPTKFPNVSLWSARSSDKIQGEKAGCNSVENEV